MEIALAFRASEIKMRLTAPISAILAFAVLFFLPATLLAKTTRHHAHRTVVSHSAHKRSTTAHLERTTASGHRRAPHAELAVAHTGGHHYRSHRRASGRSISVAAHRAEQPQPLVVATGSSGAIIRPILYNKYGRLVVPAPLRGSREILLHQNEVADRDGLTRIQDDDDLIRMRDAGMLVALPVSGGLEVDERLPANRRYCRPWTARFLANLARAHYAHFHTPLQVNSAVRTVEFQEHLLRINGNAAPAEGDTASPHLTGQAIDLAKHGLSRTEIAWMRGYLLPLIQEGKIDVEEEFQQSCFHISVYQNYVPPSSTPRRSIAASPRVEASALATALR
jgi:hypothetical protein